MLRFENTEEAERHLKLNQEKLLSLAMRKWCPLNQNPCKPTCVCFQDSYITGKSPNIYVNKARCQNAMYHDWRA